MLFRDILYRRARWMATGTHQSPGIGIWGAKISGLRCKKLLRDGFHLVAGFESRSGYRLADSGNVVDIRSLHDADRGCEATKNVAGGRVLNFLGDPLHVELV